MGGAHGVSEIQKVLDLAVELGNVIDVMANGGSIFSFSRLIDEVSALQGMNFEEFKKQIAELDAEDRGNLEMAVKAKLELHNKSLEAKIEQGVSLVEELVGIAESGLAFVMKVKALFQ